MRDPTMHVSRRAMLKLLVIGAGASVLSACAQPSAPTAAPSGPTTAPVAEATGTTASAGPVTAPGATDTPAIQVAAGAVVDSIEAGQEAYGWYDEVHPSKNIELLVWGIPGDETDPWVRAMKGGITRFGEKYPEIKVTWEPIPWGEVLTKVSSAVAANQGPDIVFEMDQEGNYARTKVIRPITEEVLPREFIKKHGFFEVRPLDDGELYWVHCAVMTPLLFCNRKLLAEQGLKVADVPTTWEEFGRFCEQLTKVDNDQMVQAGFDFNGYSGLLWDDMMYQQKAHVYSPKKSFVNTPESANAWQMIVDFYDRFRINDRTFLGYEEAFGTERAAFIYCWAWIAFSLEANYPDLDWAPVVLPTFTGEPPYGRFDYDGPGWMVTTLSQGDRLPAAWELFKFHCHEYQYLVERSHTTALILGIEPHPNYEQMFAEAEAEQNPTQEQRRMQTLAVEAREYQGGMVFPGEVSDPFYRMWNGMNDAILTNGRPIKEVLQDYEKQYDEILNNTNFWITPEA